MQYLSNWGASKKDGVYNGYQKFLNQYDIVAEIRGKQPVYTEFKDKHGNISNPATVIVQNIDAASPKPIGSFETSKEWQRTKDVTYSFTDRGIGLVDISFNNDSNSYGTEQDIYRPANTQDNTVFSRDYALTGDVTGLATAAIYVKDRLDNKEYYQVKVHNLDNTKPTIESCKVTNEASGQNMTTYLTVDKYNDFCKAIQKEGSGVNGFTIVRVNGDKSTVPPAPQNPAISKFKTQNKFAISESGWYFVYVKDRVDWISEPYPVYVDKAIRITYKPNGGAGVDQYQDTKQDLPTVIRGKLFSRTDYRFSGWNSNAAGTGTHYNSGGTYSFKNNTTLYAEWDSIYTLTVNPNGGKWLDSGEVTIKPGADSENVDTNPTNKWYDTQKDIKLGEGDKKIIPDPLKIGYNFRQWGIS